MNFKLLPHVNLFEDWRLIKMYSAAEITALGMECLTEKLGVVNMEYFIKVIKRENFDYTKWQREYFDHKGDEELREEIRTFCENQIYDGKGKVL